MTQPPTFPEFSDGAWRDVGATQALREIPDLCAEVIATLDAPNPTRRAQRMRRGKPESRPPAQLDALAALRPDPDGLHATVHTEIAHAVRAVWEDHRDLELPRIAGCPTAARFGIPPRATILGDCTWLLTHERLWTRDPFLRDFVTDSATRAHRMLQRLVRVEPAIVLRCNHRGAHGDTCGAELHEINGGHMMRCAVGHEVNHRAQILREVSLQMLPLGQLLDAVTLWWGIPRPAYEAAKKLAQRGAFGSPEHVDGRRCYNVGRAAAALTARVAG